MPYKDPDEKRANERRRYRDRRDLWLTENGPCPCGETRGLEVHHRDRGEKISHRVWTWSDGRRSAELSKCSALCSRCHRRETDLQRGLARHGSQCMYTKYGCRCTDCREAHRIANSKCRQRVHNFGGVVEVLVHARSRLRTPVSNPASPSFSRLA